MSRHVSSWGYAWAYEARSRRAAAAHKAWCSAGKASGHGSLQSVARAKEPSQDETGSMPLVLRMLLGGTTAASQQLAKRPQSLAWLSAEA